MSLLPVIDNAVALSSDASSADDVFNAGIRFTQAGLVRCTTDNATFFNQGIPMTSEGVVSVVDATAGLPADTVFLNGLPMSNNKLCVSTNSVAVVVNGITFDAAGAVVATGFSGAWTPAQLPSLALWLDADDASTITLNGSDVSQWDDKSGNGNHVSNATAATQPAYLATGWNGKPTLSFTQSGLEFLFKDGVSNFAANEDFTIASAFEFLQAFYNWDMIAGWRSVPNSNSGTSGVPVLQGMSSAQQIGYHNTDQQDTRIKVDVTTRLGKKIATISRSGGTNGNNGAATATSTGFSQATYDTDTTQTWASSAATGFQVGGRQQAATQYGDKYISEVVGCNTKLSTEDRQKLEGYLAWKWGLEADLPAGHPYKSAPPTV